MARLTAARVKTLSKPGRYGDGDGLYLNIAPGGSKSWVQRITMEGRRRDMGLGGYPAVSLARARRRVADNRAAVADGRDILSERRRPATPTFREAALTVHETNRPRWRSAKQTRNWIQTLERHAMPTLADIPVDRIGREEVLGVLTPIWTTRPETARRVRQRIRTVLRWSMAHGFVEHNVAGETIDGALPPMPQVKDHLRSLPYRDVAAALRIVEASGASLSARLCLRFVVLTAARSGEARGTTWEELDLDAREWRILGGRMKAGMEHRVPLSDAALAVLDRARPLRGRFGPGLSLSGRPGTAAVRYDADEGAADNGSGRQGDGPRLQEQLQGLVHGADRRAVGGERGGSCSYPGQHDRTGVCTERPLREAPLAHAAMGRFRDRRRGGGAVRRPGTDHVRADRSRHSLGGGDSRRQPCAG